MIIGHQIAGAPVVGDGAGSAPVFDPATGAETARVALAGRAELDAAVASASQALVGWRETSVTKRARIMFAFRDLVADHADELARLIVAEHGKVLDDARGEVQRGLEVVEFACGIPQLLKGEYSDQVSTGVDSFSFRQPVGVCAGITPFNFPVMVPMWMHPVAIACGNTFILKPSERVPSASNRIAELYAEAGLPAGVFNVLHGDAGIAQELIEHSGVAAVSFVGSTPVARSVHERGTASGKRVQALGGAKNHAVVMPDADLDDAASQLIAAGFGSAGQRCMAISVAVAVGSAAPALVSRLSRMAGEITVGPGGDSGSEMGPVVTAAAKARIAAAIGRAAEEGGELLVDGREHPLVSRDGFFLGPTLVDHVTPSMAVYREEVFGPVLAIVRVETLDEAIALINRCAYANGTAIFTSSGGSARRFQREIEVGMIGVNVPIPVPMAFHSFGGWKASLFGDTHIHGPEGVRFYTRAKVVTSRWPGQAVSPAGGSLAFPTAE